MNFIYDYTYSGISMPEIQDSTARLRTNTMNLHMSDLAELAAIEECIEAKQKLEVSTLWVIGIGGSNMGALAVYSALEHVSNTLPVYWVDTLDPLITGDLLARFTNELIAGKKPLIVIISKSGTTLETVVNADLFLDVLHRYNSEQYAQYVVAITDKESALWKQAQKQGYACLEIPKQVGGRYSVFTAVGLFPLGMLGVPVRDLCAGALQAQETTDTAMQAAIIYAHYKLGKNIHDHFVFGQRLKYLGEWYRQLMGESLGKNKTVGITPTVSTGSVDLHSVAQLYLAGPKDKFTCFLLCTISSLAPLAVPAGAYAGKTIAGLQRAIFDGTCAAYQKQKLPFTRYVFELNAFNIGYFMQSKMIEIIHLGFLLNVNPFDQPAVELYKTEVRSLLG